MRAEPGLVWHPYESSGFWAATRHADVKAVSMSPKVFSSALGHTNLWDLEADALAARRSIIDTDAPDHTRLRRLVSKAFSPNSIRRVGGDDAIDRRRLARPVRRGRRG